MGKKIIVVGGGAAGMCAAIYAARNGAEVTILEKNDRLGKKLSMTGNGRCNLTNLDMKEEYYNLSARGRMKEWLGIYGVEDVISFMKSLGVVVRSEDGYIYPASGQAQTVVNALTNELDRLGVKVIYNQQFKAVNSSEDERGRLLIKTSTDECFADDCIICSGSLSGAKSTLSTGDGYYICSKLGMTIKNTYPALVGFKVDPEEVMPQGGVRCMAEIAFSLGNEIITSEYGELQFTKDGISGIPVMQASREIVKFIEEKKPVFAIINFFPDYDEVDFTALKNDMLRLKDERTLSEFLNGFANSNINDMILSKMKLSPSMRMKNISVSMATCILDNYRNYKLKLSESYGYQASQVTTGGVSLGDIGSDMSYKKMPGVYLAGELLDVDGRCGGYNLQWAWTSGSIAGTAASI
ncbi:aminoacetone oxidase family FAD-binding enzyme [Butyrivibrio sp. MC2021]|uniref:aminoacetone oxidase family FAD-binding enzyme n=1 Tax=Butyrivibrio sp. MC2021 TaxID=1408306 RepID=UPI000478FACF|nr:aminoacetone oxidase family FAD-binding enzyme [Butyrivibrio sp. MC2021]